MQLIKLRVLALLQSQNGATAIEYALIAGLVALAIIAGLTSIGGSLGTVFADVAGKL